MTDHELLEFAAKVAVIDFESRYVSPLSMVDKGLLLADWPEGHAPKFWSPLTDDGDALRLAVKMRFSIQPISTTSVATIKRPLLVEIWRDGNLVKDCYSDTLDIYALTRRAIVQATAKIGGSAP